MLPISRLKLATCISFLFIFVVGLGLFGTIRLVTHAASTTSTKSKVAFTCGSWDVISSPNPGVGNESLYGIAAVSVNDVWAVGNTQNNEVGNPQTLIEHWDGTTWNFISSPNPSSLFNVLYGVVAISANNVWAVGYYQTSNSNFTPTHGLIEHWDGTSWSVVPSPNPGSIYNYLNGVTATSATNVWAIGGYQSSGNTLTLTEHWNGKRWKVISSPNSGTQGGLLNAATQVPGTKQVWAIGNPQTLIEHWNGTSWRVVPSPSVGTSFNYLTGVTRVPGTKQVWAVGYYNAGSYTQTLIEFYC